MSEVSVKRTVEPRMRTSLRRTHALVMTASTLSSLTFGMATVAMGVTGVAREATLPLVRSVPSPFAIFVLKLQRGPFPQHALHWSLEVQLQAPLPQALPQVARAMLATW